MLTHQEKLQAVTEAIHKACPDLLEESGCTKANCAETHQLAKDIGIAEVLRAIDQHGGMWNNYKNTPISITEELLRRYWNLTKTLAQQEEPVINLIYNIFYP